MMMKIMTTVGLVSMMLTGCATTKNVISKVHGNDTPLEQVLKLHPELRNELVTVELRQYFNRAEAPTVAEVKVTQTGLMDDSIAAERFIYSFKLNDGKWQQVNKKTEYKCGRGKNTKSFQTALCP